MPIQHIHRKYGLIGFPLTHSFSKNYFSEKFEEMGLPDCSYHLFPLENIHDLPALLAAEPDLRGLNVTLPHKQTVLPFLDNLSEEARAIGAVNVIAVHEDGLIGHNSDAVGFDQSLWAFLKKNKAKIEDLRALVLGSGGAALAVRYVLAKRRIPFLNVSRLEGPNQLTYPAISPDLLAAHLLVIQCTPLGMFPYTENCPELPYHAITEHHLFFDLVYNPEETLFLKKAKAFGAATMNGLQMLHLQAERAWEIWNFPPV